LTVETKEKKRSKTK